MDNAVYNWIMAYYAPCVMWVLHRNLKPLPEHLLFGLAHIRDAKCSYTPTNTYRICSRYHSENKNQELLGSKLITFATIKT